MSVPSVKHRLQGMDDYEFEHFIADLWERQGWTCTVSQASFDAGIDVTATKSTPYNQKKLIQAKRYGPNTTVGGPDIQQYASLKHQDPDADSVVVVTSNEFTSAAESRAQELNVKLVDGDGLVQLITSLNADDLLDEYVPIETDDESEDPTADPSASDTTSTDEPAHDPDPRRTPAERDFSGKEFAQNRADINPKYDPAARTSTTTGSATHPDFDETSRRQSRTAPHQETQPNPSSTEAESVTAVSEWAATRDSDADTGLASASAQDSSSTTQVRERVPSPPLPARPTVPRPSIPDRYRRYIGLSGWSALPRPSTPEASPWLRQLEQSRPWHRVTLVGIALWWGTLLGNIMLTSAVPSLASVSDPLAGLVLLCLMIAIPLAWYLDMRYVRTVSEWSPRAIVYLVLTPILTVFPLGYYFYKRWKVIGG